MIYFDNAATSFPKPEAVYQAIDRFNRTIGANPGRSGYATAREAARIVSDTRELLAQLFHITAPEHIVFTLNATDALNLGLKGLLVPGDHIVTTVTDHNSVLRPIRSLVDRGVITATWVACDQTGIIGSEAVRAALQPNTKLVCITHASNVTGAVHDIKAISALAHQNGTLLMVDSAQTAGCIPIDVQDMRIDLLAFTGHKGLLGPQGTGGLYVGPELEIQPFREGGTGTRSSSDQQPEQMPDRFEGGTHNTPGLAGLGAGVKFILDTGLESIMAHKEAVVERALARLDSIPGICLHCSLPGAQRVGVISFTSEGWPPLNLAHLLASGFDIATRSGLHCAPLIHSYLGTSENGTVRVSMGYFNTLGEVDALGDAVEQIVSRAK